MNNMNNINLEKQIMKRVYGVYVWRQIKRAINMKFVAIITTITAITSTVSLKHVYHNMMDMEGGVTGTFNFFGDAILNTELLVQLSIAGFLFAICLSCIDFIWWAKNPRVV